MVLRHEWPARPRPPTASRTRRMSRRASGNGQIILFASSPTLRAATLGSPRVFANAIVFGTGLGARGRSIPDRANHPARIEDDQHPPRTAEEVQQVVDIDAPIGCAGAGAIVKIGGDDARFELHEEVSGSLMSTPPSGVPLPLPLSRSAGHPTGGV